MINSRTVEILMVLFSVQIVRVYLTSFGQSSTRQPAKKYAAWVAYIVFQYLVMVTGAEYPLFNLAGNILLVALIYTLTCGGGFRAALFHSGIFYVLWLVAEVITANILLLIGTDSDLFFTAGSTLSKMIMYIAVEVHRRCRKQRSGIPLPIRYWFRLFLVPVVSMFIIYGTYILSFWDGPQTIFSIVSLLMVLINYVVFDIYDKMGMQVFMERQNQAYELQIELCSRQAAEREAAYRETRMLRHDLNDRLVGISALLEAGRTDDAAEEIGRMLQENSLYKRGISHSGNLALDALINYKYSAAEMAGAKLECQVMVPADLPADSIDLCVILGNLLDNALEAVRNLPEEQRRIKLSMRMEKDVIFIVVENPYTGEIVEDRSGQIKSSKAEKEEHGLGIASVQRTADKYNGDLDIRYDGGVFRASVLLYAQKKLYSEP